MMLTSMIYTAYILTVRPFDEKKLNYIEVFNEAIIMLCLYHMLIFTQGLTDNEQLIYLTGWSMDVILLLQFLINLLFMGYNIVSKIKLAIRRFRLRQTRKAKKA
jgi:antibiotic biosynthesis monooxygenase (ABM) superfamily enzyme